MKVKHYEKDTHNVFIRFQRFFSEGLHHFVDDHYAPFLAKALKHRYLTLSAFISMLILSIGLLAGGILRFVFFPDITADFLQVELQMNEGTPASQTHEALRRIQEGLWEVDRQVSEEQGVESGAVVSSALWPSHAAIPPARSSPNWSRKMRMSSMVRKFCDAGVKK